MKKLLTLALAIFMLCGTVLPIFAAENEITPFYNNTMRTTARFNIDESGLSSMTLMYVGYPTLATSATVITKIQKKVSNSWCDVDGASWQDEFEGIRGTVDRDFQLDSRGQYRLVYEFNIRGTGGSNDIISSTIETEY